jgi:DNA polymerase-1
MPEDLAAQIPLLHECIRAAGWPLVMIDGVEADDVIGTLAHAATQSTIDCIISTGDKDLAQLVNHHVTLINTMSNETLDEAGVLAKFGVPPERIVDYLALMGDAVDGVPGVNKVGPKTAVKWLAQYGSLDGVVTHAQDINGVVGENLRQHLDFLPLGKKLVTVVCDLDLPVAIPELTPQVPDTQKLIELFTRLEFKSWLKELGASSKTGNDAAQGDFSVGNARNNPLRADPPAPTFNDLVTTEPDRSGYTCILDAAHLDTWLARLMAAELVALDTETTVRRRGCGCHAAPAPDAVAQAGATRWPALSPDHD